jgi:hypothetical protein
MSPTRRTAALVGLVFFLVVWGLTTHAKYSATGDEPHYLMATESLVADGDLDLANNYAADAGRRFGHAGLTAGPHAARSRSGALCPVHDVGLSVLVAPLYALARGVADHLPPAALARFHTSRGLITYSLLSLAMLALTAFALAILVAVLRRRVSRSTATVVALAMALSPPVLSNAFLIFTEPIAFAVVCGVLVAVWWKERASGVTLAAAMAAVALLPWLHRKYLPFAIGLLFVIAWQRRERLARLGAARLMLLAVVLALPTLALLAWTQATWGSPGGPLVQGRVPFSLAAFREGAVGLLLDREYGLFTWAPIYLLVPAAWWMSPRETWPLLVPAALLFVPSAAHDQWWGGWAPAARFLMPLAPMCAVVVAAAMRHRAFRVAGLVLLVPQVAIVAIGWQQPRRLWPDDSGVHRVWSALPGGHFLQGALPSRVTDPDPSPWLAAAAVAIVSVALVMLSRAPRPAARQSSSS